MAVCQHLDAFGFKLRCDGIRAFPVVVVAEYGIDP